MKPGLYQKQPQMARCPFVHDHVQQALEAEWQLVSPRASPLLIGNCTWRDTEICVGVGEADGREESGHRPSRASGRTPLCSPGSLTLGASVEVLDWVVGLRGPVGSFCSVCAAVPAIGQWKVQSKCEAVGPLHQGLCLSAA